VLLLDGICFFNQFTNERIYCKDAIELSRRVEVIEDERFNNMGDKYRHTIDMQIQMKDERAFREEERNASRRSFIPLVSDDIAAKFMNLTLCVTGHKRAEVLCEKIFNLEDMNFATTDTAMVAP